MNKVLLIGIFFYGAQALAVDMSGRMEYGLWNHKQRMYYKGKEVKMHEVNPFAGMKMDQKQMGNNPMFQQMQQQMQKSLKQAEDIYKNGHNSCVTPQNINEFQDKQIPNCEKASMETRSSNQFVFSVKCKDGVSCTGEMTMEGKTKFKATTKCTGMDKAPQTSKFAMMKFDRMESTGVWVQKNCPPETLKKEEKKQQKE